MNQPKLDAYLEGLLKSRLLEKAVLQQHYVQLQRETQTRQVEGEKLGDRLVASGLLTKWQHEQLIEGRPEGFYLDKYKLLGHLGSGGMGDVYLAEHLQMNRRVAIKVLPEALIDSPAHLQRFYQECRATASLHHPNIVQAFDIDRANDQHFMVMEYVEGVDLHRLVQRQGRLKSQQVADFIRQAADGLAHAHERGMIHRDIKPSNLLVTPQGVLKILDMGIARLLDQDDKESLTLAAGEQVIGTIDYLAPEQMQNPHGVDGRADLYSLGCTMFFLLIGKPPFSSGSLAHRMMQHQIAEPPNLVELRPDTPRELVTICRKLLCKRPEERYRSAEDLSDELQDWIAKEEASSMNIGRDPFNNTRMGGTTTIIERSASAAALTQALINDLVTKRVLTPLQAEILSGRRKEPLNLQAYQLLEEISSGRLAGMFRGRHATYQFPVLVKLTKLSESPVTKEEQLAAFQREARISSQVTHNNVVRTYDVGRDAEYCFVTLENLQGRSFLELISSDARPSVPEVCRIIREAALGLQHLHEQGIIHRHVVPQNLWVGEDGRVKLFDFSLARDSLLFLDQVPEKNTDPTTEDEGYLGDPDYLAPEQAVHCDEATPLSDIYGLGCTLYHGLTGRVPFLATTLTKQVLKHATEAARPPSKLNPAVTPELDEFTLLMMSKQAEQRVRSAALVAQVLEMFLE